VMDVGTQSPGFQEWASQRWASPGCEMVTVRYHGFKDLSTARNAGVASPEFTCLGNRWRLRVFPGGYHSNSNEDMVGFNLYNLSDESIKISFGFCVRDSNGQEVAKKYSLVPKIFGPKPPVNEGTGYGFPNYSNRSILMNFLVEGALIVNVRMQMTEPPKAPTVAFIPKNPFVKIMLASFMDEESSDIVFNVGGDEAKDNAKRKAENLPAIFYAHRFILKRCASQLEELCGSGGKDTPVLINDVRPDVFRHMLHYIYGGGLAGSDLKANAKEIIDAADKYGVSSLKLEAEASLVNATIISVENMMDHLLYADSKNCAHLKEAVMDFIVENKVNILQKVSFKDVPGTMISDVLAAMARGEKKPGNDKGSDEDQLSIMRISDLRERVHQKGLDVDGSRETLIAALEEKPVDWSTHY